MKRMIVLVAMLFTAHGQAQVNLVPNPSFEDTVACPTSADISFASGWFNCNFYSPDYYNSCANTNTPSIGVPYNWQGNQQAYHGDGYSGIVTWYPGVREIIGVQLTQSLVPGTKYYVSAYVSKSDSGDVYPYSCVCDKLGFKFSLNYYDQTAPVPIDNMAHVYTDSVLYNENIWTKISGSFIADSAYEFIYVGNFFTDMNTDTSNCGYQLAYAYSYVDAICVSTDSLCIVGIDGSVREPDETTIFFPNPCTDILYIKGADDAQFSILSLDGRLVESGMVRGVDQQIPVSHLPDGNYMLVLNERTYNLIIIH